MSKTGTLTPGQTLGRYEIAAFLAAGGMGEVYKAFDARLNRVVAIKRLTGPRAGGRTRSRRAAEQAHTLAPWIPAAPASSQLWCSRFLRPERSGARRHAGRSWRGR